jgi:hypothetical protein
MINIMIEIGGDISAGKLVVKRFGLINNILKTG